MPGNVSYNGYMATRELLRAIERAGSTNNLKVIKALEGHKMPAADRMQHFDAYIDPATHQVQQTIYLARRNAKPDGQDRPVRDPQLDQAGERHRRRRAGQVQAEGRRRRSELRDLRRAAASSSPVSGEGSG